MRKEIVWVDWVKFVCMVFVYWCHVDMLGTSPCPFSIPYTPFFVNAFFFVSGYLIFRKQLSSNEISLDYKKFMDKNTKNNGMLPNIMWKIAIPSALFSMINYLPKRFVGDGVITLTDFLVNTLIRGTNWFTCTLVVSELVLFVILCFRFKKLWIYCLIGVLLTFLGRYLQLKEFLLMDDPYLPWFYKSGLVSIVFLVAGGIYSQYEDMIDHMIGRYTIIVAVILLLIYLFLYNSYSSRISVSTIFGLDFGGFLISLLSIFVLIFFCKNIIAVPFVRFVSRHSIGFYFMSASVPYVSCRIIERFIPVGSISFLIEFIISFNGAALIVFLLNRFMPWLFDLRKLSKSYDK